MTVRLLSLQALLLAASAMAAGAGEALRFPAAIDFGEVMAGDSAARLVRCRNLSTNAFVLAEMECPAELQPDLVGGLVLPGREAVFTLAFAAGDRAGAWTGQIRFGFSYPVATSVVVRVSAEVVPPEEGLLPSLRSTRIPGSERPERLAGGRMRYRFPKAALFAGAMEVGGRDEYEGLCRYADFLQVWQGVDFVNEIYRGDFLVRVRKCLLDESLPLERFIPLFCRLDDLGGQPVADLEQELIYTRLFPALDRLPDKGRGLWQDYPLLEKYERGYRVSYEQDRERERQRLREEEERRKRQQAELERRRRINEENARRQAELNEERRKHREAQLRAQEEFLAKSAAEVQYTNLCGEYEVPKEIKALGWKAYLEGEGRRFADGNVFREEVFIPFYEKEWCLRGEASVFFRTNIADIVTAWSNQVSSMIAARQPGRVRTCRESYLRQRAFERCPDDGSSPFLLALGAATREAGRKEKWKKGKDGNYHPVETWYLTRFKTLPEGRAGAALRFLWLAGDISCDAVWRLTPLPELAAMRAQALVEWCRALEAEGARPEIWCAVYLVLAQVSYDYRSCTSYTVKGKPGPLVTTHCFDDYAEALKAAKVAPLLEEMLRGSDWIRR